MPRMEDIVLASSMLEDTSNDSFIIHKEVHKPFISNEVKKEESLTPPELAEQYKLDFTEYLKSSTYLEKQNFFSMPKEIIKETEQILKEHSYFKKIDIR